MTMSVLEAQRIAIGFMGTDDYQLADDVVATMDRADLIGVMGCLAGFGKSAWLGLVNLSPMFDTLPEALAYLLEHVERFEGDYPEWGQT